MAIFNKKKKDNTQTIPQSVPPAPSMEDSPLPKLEHDPNGIIPTRQPRTATPGIVDDNTAASSAVSSAASSAKAPLGATYQDRIKNGTASDDDIRIAAEEYKKGNYTPGPKTMEEFKKMGLIDTEPTAEQPQTETPQPNANAEANAETTEPSAEPTAEQTTDNAEANTETTEPSAEPTAEPTAEQEEAVQEQTEQVQDELKSKTDDEMKEYIADIERQLNTNDQEKAKMAGIFQAYKNGDIDKNQRNYFLADAIARFANNIGEIQETKNQNALWANITSGNQKSAKVDLSPNEWQNYLKTDWQEAQKLKNEAKSKAVLEKVQMDMDALKQKGMDKYLYNDYPEMVKSSYFMNLPDDERTEVAQAIATVKNGAPFNADQLGNVSDPTGNAKLGNALGDQQLRSAVLGNDMQNAQIVAQGITNNVQQAFAMKYAEQQFRSTEEAIEALKKDNKLKDELLQLQKIENEVANDTKDAAKRKIWADANNTAWDGAGIEVNIAGQKVKVPFSAIQTLGGEAIRSVKSEAKNAVK